MEEQRQPFQKLEQTLNAQEVALKERECRIPEDTALTLEEKHKNMDESLACGREGKTIGRRGNLPSLPIAFPVLLSTF